ncbi:MAG: hypothetical protein RL077_3146 [Verrucomicrobiota bacterium]|jgi:hypothetical protein
MNPHPIIELPVAEWKTALTGLSKVISKRTSLPVLEHLRVTRTAAGAVTLQATDLDVTATYLAAQPNAGEPCDFLVPFAPLNQSVKGSKEIVQRIAEADGPIRLRTFIGASPMEQAFAPLPVDEFPPMPLVTGNPVPLDATFRDRFRQALDCCSDECKRRSKSAAGGARWGAGLLRVNPQVFSQLLISPGTMRNSGCVLADVPRRRRKAEALRCELRQPPTSIRQPPTSTVPSRSRRTFPGQMSSYASMLSRRIA